MTAIVGLVDNGDVYIGGDSAGIAGLSISVRADEKVFGNGPFIFGFTSSFRMGQLLRYKFSPPAQTVHQSDMEYMVTSFIDACRQCFSGNGFGDKDATIGGTFLVGYKGQLYTIEGDYQVGLPACGFDAVGCGTDLALGAMFATEGMNPQERIEVALSAASTFSAGVSAPFTIMKLAGEVPQAPKVKKASKKAPKKTAK
jgi:ATP-dependent protease HslVU (ClpYQ) peptidase subunit